MKLHGQSLDQSFTQSFLLPRGDGTVLTFRLKPLSLGFHQRLRLRGIQSPTPPVKIARDSSGKPLRDAAGHAVTMSETRDPEYLAELERYHQRVAVLAVVDALQADPAVSFETSAPAPDESTSGNWEQFADAIFQELEQAGFSAGDLILLSQEICRISNLLDDHLSAAQANFSSPLPSGST